MREAYLERFICFDHVVEGVHCEVVVAIACHFVSPSPVHVLQVDIDDLFDLAT